MIALQLLISWRWFCLSYRGLAWSRFTPNRFPFFVRISTLICPWLFTLQILLTCLDNLIWRWLFWNIEKQWHTFLLPCKDFFRWILTYKALLTCCVTSRVKALVWILRLIALIIPFGHRILILIDFGSLLHDWSCCIICCFFALCLEIPLLFVWAVIEDKFPLVGNFRRYFHLTIISPNSLHRHLPLLILYTPYSRSNQVPSC